MSATERAGLLRVSGRKRTRHHTFMDPDFKSELVSVTTEGRWKKMMVADCNVPENGKCIIVNNIKVEILIFKFNR